MRMHKLEIHTTEEGLARLDFLNWDQFLAAGHHKIEATILSADSSANTADVKIEAFINEVPSDLATILASDNAIFQYNLNQCSQIYLFEATLTEEEDETVAENVQPPFPEPVVATAQPVSASEIDIEVKDLPSGQLKLTLKSGNTTFFLSKVVGVLANSDIPLEKAQTFPQSDHITGTFVIPRINAEQLSYIKGEIGQELALTQMGNCGYKKFSRAAIPPDELKIFLDTSGSMASLKIKCEKNDILSRFTILEAISLYDLEIAISRLGGLGKRIDDVYYVKPIKSTSVTEDLVLQIRKHITGAQQ